MRLLVTIVLLVVGGWVSAQLPTNWSQSGATTAVVLGGDIKVTSNTQGEIQRSNVAVIPNTNYRITVSITAESGVSNLKLEAYQSSLLGETEIASPSGSLQQLELVVNTVSTPQNLSFAIKGDFNTSNQLYFYVHSVKVEELEEVLLAANCEPYSSGGYRYGFQGQEKDEEIKGSGNSYNYKFRMHDTRLGRFYALDPLAPKYPHNSPYAFSENMLINCVELEGLESFDVIVQPHDDDPKLSQVYVIKTKKDGPLSVTYREYDADGKVIRTYTQDNFNENSLEKMVLNSEYQGTGNTVMEQMSVRERYTKPNGTEGYRLVEHISKLAGFIGYTYDLSVRFKSDQACISEEGVQPGQYQQAIDDINQLSNIIGSSVEVMQPAGTGHVDFRNFHMMVSGETDSNHSNYPDESGNACGNPCLGQDRADELLETLEYAHPTNNSTTVVNHTGTVKAKDRNATVFFFPTWVSIP